MIDPTDDDIGRAVLYVGNQRWGGTPQPGVVTSFNKYAVFVLYDYSATPRATFRGDLEWDNEKGETE